jgi:amino acid adenylation domain-containing protein
MSAGYELSPQQKQLFAQKQENATAGVALLFHDDTNGEKLRDAVAALVERHEILRSVFQRRTGMKVPFQVLRENGEFRWSEVDLSSIDESEQEGRVRQVLDSLTVDIENGPVLHASWLKLGASRQVLVLAFSVLCVDEVSLDLIASEIGAHVSGRALSGEVLQYADFSEWQNQWLLKDDEESGQAKRFWEESQWAAMPPLSLPFERKHANPSARGDSVPISAVLPANADEAEIFLLACWQVLLSRMTGQREFALAYRSDGRKHDEFQRGLGVYVKSLPLAAQVRPDRAFSELLAHIGNTRAGIREWEDYLAADQIGDRLRVGFDFRAVPDSGEGITELARYAPIGDSRITLRCSQKGNVSEIALLFDPAFFSSETVSRFGDRFATLCRAARLDPGAAVGTLPITSETERHQVTVEFNRTAAEFPQQQSIPQLFEAAVEKYSTRPALAFGKRELSYSELNGEANRIAHVLGQCGVSSNVPVALCLERSAEMIIVLLGILKAGGCYLPLIPDNPKARLAHQLSESGAPVLITETKNLDRLPEFQGKIICLDRDHNLLDAASTTNPNVRVSPDDLVYVIYTSGSTGVPKGVAVRHSNLVNYSHFICKRLKIDQAPEGLHFATVSTMAADLGNTSVFPALISGGCLHVIGYEMAMSSALFAEYAAKHPIDVLKITPSHLSSLMDVDPSAVLPRTFLILGGEALRWDLIERVHKAGTCAILNHYGPTEATVGCCTFCVDNSDVSHWAPATVPIGRAIANDQVYILDERMQPVPIGVAGELCVGGAGIAKGYLNQPEQTAEKFIADPFRETPGARIYRTGDLARFLPDGNVEFLGRIDQQVKIRGFRVEPPEIESVLKRHPAVKQAAVIAFDDKSGEKRLAAYVVGNVRSEQLRGHLAQELPDYMIPSSFVALDSLPLTANGKLDVRALPSPDTQPAPHSLVAPRTPEEEKLAEIWRQVLKLDQVGITDDFFDLGGHSLLATQIISRIRSQFRVQMPLQVFLQNPTITALAPQLLNFPTVETEQEEMARLLQELEGISEEEAERLLAAELEKDESGR